MRNKPITVLFVTIFIDLMGFGIVIPVLPIYANELGASGTMIGLITASFAIMQFLFAPFWGGLSDRFGRRPILLASIGLMGMSYLLLAQGESLWLLLLSRMLAGVGAANISTANAFISDVTPAKDRSKNFGLVGAAFGLGFIFGPPLGGFLKDHFGMASVGYVSAAMAGGNLLMAYFMLPESLHVEERTGKKRLFPNPFGEIIRVLPRKQLSRLILSNFLFLSAFSMMQITASLLWKGQFELSEAEIGYTFAFVGVTMAIVQGGLIGPFTRWFGEKRLYVVGSILMAMGLAILPLVPPDYFVPLELVGLLLISFGNAFFTPSIFSLISQRAGRQEQGKILGLMQSVGSLSRVVGPFIGGTLYGAFYYLPFLVAAGAMVGVCLFSLYIVRRLEPLGDAPPAEKAG
jgi:multidrug resistance protein